MNKKVVIALGGNALGSTLSEQMDAVKYTAKAIADLVEANYDVVIAHGNGPQVGMINNAFAEYGKVDPKFPFMPLSMCVAMSQAYIGYDLQNALREELLNRGIKKPVTSIITQVVVDEKDPAFARPTKPIGPFMTEQEAEAGRANGMIIVEDSGRGYRRVVASPKPQDIVEIDTIKDLMQAGQLVIACGGGGIPVVKEGSHLRGVGAVIDKDFASSLLAEKIDADSFVVLTAVEKVAIRFGKPDQEWLSELDIPTAETHIANKEFAEGSMLPKVRAAIAFAASKQGRKALITSLEKAADGLAGKTGTWIHS
ncbi:carbamate kinase [Sedimentibacter hydroxybenzoicus DSM 7310]|uniref:Carbamate kinase n=1 Tax=Sedimentibacter hydroxybenzoicus DSM 7310 TaxID=1123245 RepID=A0A974BGD9_SEDHY|nr:carbamate kinase [Sedimentibacter hydroxybenzoicus]NYB72568.1 carbamate kinase [Sedimentibacter hydroxybenzoicus DSM 7310]